MGDMADDAYIKALAQEARRESEEFQKKKRALKVIDDYAFGDLQWQTRAGDSIYVDEMTISHIENCLAKVKQKDNVVALAWVRVFNQELRKRNN